MKEREIVIIGGKGTAINIAEQIEDARTRFGYPMRVRGFAIDEPGVGADIAGFPVVAGVRDAWATLSDAEVDFIFALYRPDVMAARMALLLELGIPKERLANFVHPSAYVSQSVTMGVGNVIMSNATVHHGVSIGSFNIVNSNVVVEHDSSIADGTFIAASVCVGSHVEIGSSAFIGLNATIRENVAIEDRAFVGMGSCVLSAVESGVVAYGVPARRV